MQLILSIVYIQPPKAPGEVVLAVQGLLPETRLGAVGHPLNTGEQLEGGSLGTSVSSNIHT